MIGLSVTPSAQFRDAQGRFASFSAASPIDQGLLTYGNEKVGRFAMATPVRSGAAASGWRGTFLPSTHTFVISNVTPYGMALAVGGRGPYDIPGAFGRPSPFGIGGRFGGRFHPAIKAIPSLAVEVRSIPTELNIVMRGIGGAILGTLEAA